MAPSDKALSGAMGSGFGLGGSGEGSCLALRAPARQDLACRHPPRAAHPANRRKREKEKPWSQLKAKLEKAK